MAHGPGVTGVARIGPIPSSSITAASENAPFVSVLEGIIV
jgi:hypothetical protein